jgi:hypothetical protein
MDLATEEMIQVAKDEDVDLDLLIQRFRYIGYYVYYIKFA